MSLNPHQKACLHAMGIHTYCFENKPEIFKKKWLIELCQLLKIDLAHCQLKQVEQPAFDADSKTLTLPENQDINEAQLKRALWSVCREHIVYS